MQAPLILEIGKRFVVVRGAVDYSAGGRLPILLAHGRAFGSGEHETTRSCLEEMEALPLTGETRVLDLGSGTGVLAVAAARLGAGTIVALDTSIDAVRTTQATVRLNGIEPIVSVIHGEVVKLKDCRFDLIVSNLYGDLLIGMAGTIQPLLEPGSYLLLSGISYEDAYDVRRSFGRAGCRLQKERCLEDYVTQVFRRE